MFDCILLKRRTLGRCLQLNQAEVTFVTSSNLAFVSTNLFAVELRGSLCCCHTRLPDPSLQSVPGARGFLGLLAYHHLLWSLEFPAWFHLLNLQTEIQAHQRSAQ